MWAKTGYTLTQPDAVQARFQTLNGIRGGKPLYNIRPEMKVPFVCYNQRREKILLNGLFGFMPPWASKSQRDVFPHARSEDILDKKTFQDAFATNRCLVVADGFFVWDQTQPYYVRLTTRGLFGIAGIFSLNYNYNPTLTSFALLTTFPNVLIMDAHHRMPVIIRPEDETRYLDPRTPIKDVQNMLVAYDDGEMEMWAVSPRLNTTINNSRAFVQPVNKQSSLESTVDKLVSEQLSFLE